MSEKRDVCVRCGLPLVRLGDKAGLIEWACPNHSRADDPCPYRAFRANDIDDQQQCPHCHCADLLWQGGVRDTRLKSNGPRRYRVCRNCGLTFRTREVVEA